MVMWRKLEDLRRSWRPWFVVGFFALLALGLYLGMRPTPPPAAYSWQAGILVLWQRVRGRAVLADRVLVGCLGDEDVYTD